MNVIVNPPGIQETYLAYLNTCFPHWGDQDFYRWCFERQIGALQADLMLVQNEGRIVAGSAVTYRPVMLKNKTMNVGIMTGSWTLPATRGQGCFTRIIEESVRLASAKDAALLLAFVTETNASFRRLAAAGAALFPTHYIFSDEQTPIPPTAISVSPVANVNACAEEILGRLQKRSSGHAHFIYSIAEWRSQFLERPSQIECVEIGADNFAIIEQAEVFDRVLCLSPVDERTVHECVQSLLKRALENQRRLFLFTTSPAWQATCMNLGMGHTPGYLTMLKTNLPGLGDLESLNWNIQSGDRM